MNFKPYSLHINQATAGSSPWLQPPGWSDVRLGVRLFFLVDVLIFSCYGSANWFASLRDFPLNLYFPEELSIPLVPWMIWVYLSLFPLFLLLFFCVQGDKAYALARAYITSLFLSTSVWLAFPAKLGYPRVLPPGYEGLYELLFALDLPHNLFPSLHVAFGYLTVSACCAHAPRPAYFVLWGWFWLMVASTFLTHQHHLLDAACGLLVARISLMPDLQIPVFRSSGEMHQ